MYAPNAKTAVNMYNNYFKNKYLCCLLYENNKPLFIVLKSIGLLPFSRRSDGRFELRLLSFPMLYALIATTAVTIGMIYSFTVLWTVFMSQAISFRGSLEFIKSSVVYLARGIPLIAFFEINKFLGYLNHWIDFEKQYLETTQTKLKLRSPWKINLFLAISLVLLVYYYAVTVDPSALVKGTIWLTIPYTWFLASGFGIFIGLLLLWKILASALEDSTNAILKEILDYKWKPRNNLEDYFKLWLDVQELCVSLGDILSWTYLALTSVAFLTCLLSLRLGAFGKYLSALGPAVYMSFILAVIFETSHALARKIGREFEMEMKKMYIRSKDKHISDQLKGFITEMKANPPVVCLGGYFNIDRGGELSLYGTFLTYLIIIMQMSKAHTADNL